jgi:GT2 family glycosyltransferase
MPLCSVILVNWNGRAHLPACLAALARQSFRNFEVVLVDNGSTDGSIEYLRERHPEVLLVCLGRNTGFAAGCNAGISKARGEYLIFLNNDTEAETTWLEELVSAARDHPAAGFFASKILFFDDHSRIDSAGDELGTNGVAQKRGHRRADAGFEKSEPVFGACAAAALYRRNVLAEIGGFDEDFFLIFEDADLSFRAQLAGYSCVFVPSARVYHKSNASIGTLSETYVYYGHRNLEFVFFQNMPASLLLRFLPTHLLYDALALLHFAARGRAGAFLRAKASAFREIPAILRKRRRVQRSRRRTPREVRALVSPGWLKDRWRLRRLRPLKAETPQ